MWLTDLGCTSTVWRGRSVMFGIFPRNGAAVQQSQLQSFPSRSLAKALDLSQHPSWIMMSKANPIK
jgi:hypothetical protein